LDEEFVNRKIRELKELVGPEDWDAVEESITVSTTLLSESLSENPEPEIAFDSREELEDTVKLAVIDVILELAGEKKLDYSSPDLMLQRIGDKFAKKWIEIVKGAGDSSDDDFLN